jgi:hypothetical protein
MQMENFIKSLSTIAVAVLLIATPACIAQQVVGSTKLGVAYAELRDVTTGWSAKLQVLGKNVFNDKGETIGKIDDIIVAPDKRCHLPSSRRRLSGCWPPRCGNSGEPAEREWWKSHPSGWFEGRNQGFA